MSGKLQENHRELFRTRLEDLINPGLSYFEDAFKPALLFGQGRTERSRTHDGLLFYAQTPV